MKNTLNHQRGQILIVFALGLIVLLGFVALAIDGGMIMEERRFDQTVADNASLAASEAAAEYYHGVNTTDCTTSAAAINAAVSAAKSNAAANVAGLTLESSLANGNGVVATCSADPTPVISITVMVTRPVDTSFVHLFTSGEVSNTVTSAVDYYPPHDLGAGNTIVALDKGCDGGITLDGNSTVAIDKGGVWSNSCLTANGTALSVTVDDGSIIYHTGSDYKKSGKPTISPTPKTSNDYIEIYDVGEVACTNAAYNSYSLKKGSDTISPGNYSSITVQTKNASLTMEPGLYCLKGDFTVTGGSIVGDGVTIYLMPTSGGSDTDLKITGTGTLQLSAPDSDCTNSTCPPAIKGMLFYMDPDNQGSIAIEGNSSSVFQGVVYAPYASIDIGGTSGVSSTSFGIQIIGDTVKIHGNVSMDLTYSDDFLFLTTPLYDQTQ